MTHRLTIYMQDEPRKKLDELCQFYGESISALIRRYIQNDYDLRIKKEESK